MKSAAIRAQVEAALGSGFPSPFAFRETDAPETVSCGVPEIDALTGGLPRGSLIEIFGPPSSGRTSLMLAMVAEGTAREEACALVDARDALDPYSAAAAGVELRRVLWVRCHGLEQALRAADLLVEGGGFGVVVVDLGDIPPSMARRVPLSSWFRFRRAVERTPTVLALLSEEPCAKNCASLGLRLETSRVYWSQTAEKGRNLKMGIRNSAPDGRRVFHSKIGLPIWRSPHACLLREVRLRAEVVGSRLGTRSREFGTPNPVDAEFSSFAFSSSNNPEPGLRRKSEFRK